MAARSPSIQQELMLQVLLRCVRPKVPALCQQPDQYCKMPKPNFWIQWLLAASLHQDKQEGKDHCWLCHAFHRLSVLRPPPPDCGAPASCGTQCGA